MTEAQFTSADRSTYASIEQNAESGNVQGALQEVRDYLNQNPNNPNLVSEMTAEMERNGVLPLLMVEAFGNNVDIAEELSAYDDNGDGILSRTELVNGAGDSASLLFGQFLAERLDLTETGESIDALTARVPQALVEYQSFQPQLTTVELTVGLMSPIQTAEGAITVFDLIDNAHGGARDGVVSYRDIEHFIYWAEHDSSNGWAQAILDAGLTIEDLRAFQNNYDAPPYNTLRIGGNGDITVDSLLTGSGYNLESGSIALRDESGRISEIHYADGTNRSFVYDQAGQLVTVVQPDGSRVSMNPETHIWEVNGQPFARNIVVTPDGQMTVTRDGVSATDGSPMVAIDYIGLDGAVTTTESRSVLTANQLHDRATVINEALANGNTDLVITLLSSMTSADLLSLSDYYRVQYGVELDRDGNVSETDRSLIHSSLFRVGDSNADFVSAVDHAMSLTDSARREEALRNIFSTMSSEQIALFEQNWLNQHGGQSFRDYLFGDTINLSDGTRRCLEIYMQGTDANFVTVPNEAGATAAVYMNDADAVQLGIIALESRNLEMFAEAMRTASPEARACFAQDGEGRAAFIRAFGRDNARANDYVEWGELTLATIIPENANALWTYTDRISTALINIPEDQRVLYARGRELAESNIDAASAEDQRAIDYYTELNSVLRNYSHGALAGFNEYQFALWESQLLYGDSLITQVMSLEQAHTLGIGGTYHDRDAVMSTIETMSREDFDLLFVQDESGNYPYRELFFDSLDIMLSDEEMVEVRGIIGRMVEAHDAAQETTAATEASLTGEPAPDAYQLALKQGQRFLDEIIAENSWDAVIGWQYQPADIINGIINMSPEEQELYRQNTYVEGKGNYRDYIDGLIRDRLDSGPEMQLATLLLRQIAEGGEPEMGPLARVLYADMTNAPAGQLITDIEAIFDPNTLNDETLSAAERDLITRIQAGETVEIFDGDDSVSINRDYFVRLASETLANSNVYVPLHYSFESLSQNPEHVLWSLFDPNGNHTLPLEIKIGLAEGNDQQVIQAVLDASPAELLTLQQEISAGGGELLTQILSELDEEDRQAVLQVLTNTLTPWDGQSALQLAPEDEIRLITLGAWENSSRMESILSGMSTEEIAVIQASYSAKYGDMHADALTLIGEDDEAAYARIDRLLTTRGDFDARETFFNQMFEYFDVRSGLAANFAPVIGARDTARMVFDDFGAELSELMGANMTPEQHAEFQDRFMVTIEAFSEAKASFTEQFVMAVETIVGIGCAFIPGLQIMSAKVLISMFIAGGLMRVKMRDWMLGNEYDWDNQGSDFLLGGIQMAANVLGPDFIISRLPVFKNLLAGTIDDLAVRGIQIAAEYTDDFSRAVVNAIQAGGELSDDAALAIARQMNLGDEVAGVLRQVVNDQIAENFTRAGRLATEVLANVGTGSIAGGVTGGLDAALHIPQGADAFEALQHILNSAAMGAASGAGGAIVFTAGFKFVGRLLRGPEGSVAIRPEEGTAVIRADGSPATPENGIIPIRPGDRILVNGEEVPLDVLPLAAAKNRFRGELTGDGATANNLTPEEIIAGRNNRFPSILDEGGNIRFLRRATDYTPEQMQAIRELFERSQYTFADFEKLNRWITGANQIFSRWNGDVDTLVELLSKRSNAEISLGSTVAQIMADLGDDWPESLTLESIMQNPASLRDFFNSPDAPFVIRLESRLSRIDDVIAARQEIDALMQSRVDELQIYLNQVCKEAGLPPVRLRIDTSLERLGGYADGILYLNSDYFLNGEGAGTLFHELIHHNQQSLILWRLADALQMSSSAPPPWRLRPLVSHYKLLTGLDLEINDEFLTDLLALRAGKHLSQDQAALADELVQTWGRHVDTTDVDNALELVDDALSVIRNPYTGSASSAPSSIQYARTFIQERIDAFILAGYTQDEINNWTDSQAVTNLLNFLNSERRTLIEESLVLFDQYARQAHEWDAQMFGFLVDNEVPKLANEMPENLPPVYPPSMAADDISIQALRDEPPFEFEADNFNKPNGSDDGTALLDANGEQIGVQYTLLDGSFENHFGNGAVDHFDNEGNLIWSRVPQSDGRFFIEYPNGQSELFNVDGSLVGRLLPAEEDGSRFFMYADGVGFEKHYPDGSYEVHNPSRNSVEFFGKDGDLLRTEIRTNGSLEVIHSNGRREILSADLTLETAALRNFANQELPAARAQRLDRLMTSFDAQARAAGIAENQIAIAYKQINRLLSQESGTVMSLTDRMILAEQLLYMAANPTRVNQGMTMGCQVACLQKVLLGRDPAALFGMVADVATTGRYVTESGVIVDMARVNLALNYDTDALSISNRSDGSFQNMSDIDGDNSRNGASQVIQSTLANIPFAMASDANSIIRYERIFDPMNFDPATYVPPVQVGLIGDHGITSSRLGEIFEQVTGYKSAPFVIEVGPTRSNMNPEVIVRVNTAEELAQQLSSMQNENFPAIIMVNAANEPFRSELIGMGSPSAAIAGSHVVTVHGIRRVNGQWVVDVSNQWSDATEHIGQNAMRIEDLFTGMTQVRSSSTTAVLPTLQDIMSVDTGERRVYYTVLNGVETRDP